MACEYHYDCRECSEDEKKAIEEAVSASLGERDRLKGELDRVLALFSDYEEPCETVEQAEAIWNSVVRKKNELRGELEEALNALKALWGCVSEPGEDEDICLRAWKVAEPQAKEILRKHGKLEKEGRDGKS